MIECDDEHVIIRNDEVHMDVYGLHYFALINLVTL